MTSLRLIEENKDNTNSKLNKFGYNTSQNFRKKINKLVPSTPSGRIRERTDKIIDRNFNLNDKNGFESFTSKNNNNSKKIEYVYEKNIHSRTLILNPLSDIDERIEKYANNTKKINKKKGILYKTDKKSTFFKLNFQLDTITENKKNKIINNKISIKDKDKENETNKVQNIVKLVDDVNQNLNKILNENQGIKKGIVKDVNKNSRINEKINTSNKSIINAIKEVNIQQRENNETNKSIDTTKIKSEENIIKTTNENISNNIVKDKSINNDTPDKPESSKFDNSNININRIKYNLNNYEKYFKDDLKITTSKKNKSATSNKSHNIFNINKLKYNKSYKNYKDIEKNNILNIKKEDTSLKEKKKSENEGIKNVKIINNLEIIKTIRNKMKENINKINRDNKNEINKKEILNKDVNQLINKNEEINNIILPKE